MPTLKEFRAQYPMYDDMSDGQLADALHSKHYSDIPREEFNKRIEFNPAVDTAKAKRDEYYSSGIYAGEYNPLGPVMKTLDAGSQGIGRAALMGWDDEAVGALRTAGGLAGDYTAARDQAAADKAAMREQNPIASTAGELAGLTVGAVNAPSFAGRAVNAGSSLLRTAAASALDGAALGAVQGAGDADPGERLASGGYGALGGAAVGGAIPVAAQALTSGARRAITPFASSPERMEAADILLREGIETTAGQRTGSKGLKYAESELGGRRADELVERQGEQFTAAALRRTGTDANRATPEVIDDAFSRIGHQFNDLATRNTLVPDQQLLPEVGNVLRGYEARTSNVSRVPLVQEYAAEIAGQATRGPISGQTYQNLSSELAREARAATKRQDHAVADALYDMRSVLDDNMERSMATAGSPDIGAWQETRNQYRNLLTIQKAAAGAGEDAALGIISPSKLRSATVTTQGAGNYARGRGDFSELSRAGEAIMRPMPNSGTAGRLKAQALGTGVTSAMGLGGAGYASGGDPTSMVAGAAAGFAAPRLAGNVLLSRAFQNYLGNQAAARPVTPEMQRIINALMQSAGVGQSEDVGRGLIGAMR
jgi:hypothetical protein